MCEALSDEGFRRLRHCPSGRPGAVPDLARGGRRKRLCRDWRRRQRGRDRPFQAVARLPELDQQVYRLMFVQGSSRAECVETLAMRFPGLTDTTVAEISRRLFGLLTPQQRWQLSARPHAPIRSGSRSGNGDDDPVGRVEAAGPGPEEEAAALQEQRQLRQALSRLTPEQRLLLRLRYEQGLTLAEVARLTRQPDPFRANRQVQAALAALARLMSAPGSDPDRKND